MRHTTPCRIFRAMQPINRYICSGDGPGTHEVCDFRTDSLDEAMDHFEATGHAVDEQPTGCVDRDHGIGDHPCDEVLGAAEAARLRDYGDEQSAPLHTADNVCDDVVCGACYEATRP